MKDSASKAVNTNDSFIYDELLDLLVSSADAQRIRTFKISPAVQSRLDLLLEKNREGTLSETERAEMESFDRFEHVVRLLKVRAAQKRAS